MQKALVISNDPAVSGAIQSHLETEQYDVKIATEGAIGITACRIFEPDVVLLDIDLPSKDGFQICREIREWSNVPLLFVSAQSEVFNVVLALELGADDFVGYPFDPKELSARIKAVIRRCLNRNNHLDSDLIRFENMEISLSRHELRLRGKLVDIPHKELELLYFLAANYNHVFTRDQLLDKVWSFDYAGDTRTVDVHIKRLRKKLEGVSEHWCLKTIWAVGYKFEVTECAENN